MSKDIIMHQYNGTEFETVYPQTKASLVLNLSEAVADKEDSGYLTIGGTKYQLRLGSSGENGYITIEVI